MNCSPQKYYLIVVLKVCYQQQNSFHDFMHKQSFMILENLKKLLKSNEMKLA